MTAACSPEDALAALLTHQCGVLSRGQAMRLGLSDGAIAARLRARRWQRVHPGTFAAFTGPLPWLSRVWAALLLCGEGAVASHGTAARLHGLRDPAVDRENHVHVSVPAARRATATPEIVVHRSRLLPGTMHPARTPPRTRVEDTVIDLVDAARCLEDALALLAGACQQHLTTAGRLAVAVEARERVRFRGRLLPALHDIARGAHSLLELHYLQRVEQAHGLPAGQRQVGSRQGLTTRYRDVDYPGFAVRVELDGRLGHDGALERWRDLRRDNAAAAEEGALVLRYGWADVEARPCAVAAQVVTALRSRGWEARTRRCGRTCGARTGPPPLTVEDPASPGARDLPR